MATTDAGGTLVDANVLIDILQADPDWLTASTDAFAHCSADGVVGLNQIVYAELSARYPRAHRLDGELGRLGVARFDLPWEAAPGAARAFVAYRRAGGRRRSPPPDFYIGAHAEVSGLRLLTRDAQRYRTYFPDVELLVP